MRLNTIEVKEAGCARFVKVAFDESILNHKCSLPQCSQFYQNQEASSSWFHFLFRGLYQERVHSQYQALLIASAVSFLSIHGTYSTSMPHTQSHKLCSEAIKIANECFTDNITLEKTAARLMVKPQYLSKIFSTFCGITFKTYLCNLRLRRAVELLQTSSMTVTEICFACGYQNLSNFLRSFKSKYGVTPVEFRKKGKKMQCSS